MSVKTPINMPIAIILMIAPFILAGIAYYFFLRRRKREELEQDKVKPHDDEPYEADVCEEPPLTEIRATVLRMRCEVNTYGTKTPHCEEEYFVTFLDEYEKEITFSVDKETYLSLSEGQKGTVAVVNDRFYGFAED